MPYKVYPDGTIETDTVEEILGVVKAMAVDSILGAKYSMATKDSTEEFLRLTDEIVRLVQEKGRIEAELEVLLQRQKELVGKKDSSSKSAPSYKGRSKPRPSPIVEPEPDYHAVIGLEVIHNGDTHSVGERMAILKWGDRGEQELLRMAQESLDFFGVRVDLKTVQLTQRDVETLRAGSSDTVFYCSDLGIEVP